MDSFRTEDGRISVPAGPSLQQMMENAGRSLASLCTTMVRERGTTGPVIVVAGTGGNGGGGLCAARHLANHGVDVIVVVDVPSGIDASNGDAPGIHVRATATMTLALPKTGLHVDPVGELWVSDIGIPWTVFERAGVAGPPAGLFSSEYTVRLVRPSDGADVN